MPLTVFGFTLDIGWVGYLLAAVSGCAGPQYGATGLPSLPRALRARRVDLPAASPSAGRDRPAVERGALRRQARSPTMALRLARLGYRGLRALASLSLARSDRGWLLNLYNFMDGIDGNVSIEVVTTCI